MKKFHCHGCGREFPHSHGADLYCSPECGKKHAGNLDKLKADIQAKGFAPVAGILNLWHKSGVHITTEQVLREGMDLTLARHAEAVRKR